MGRNEDQRRDRELNEIDAETAYDDGFADGRQGTDIYEPFLLFYGDNYYPGGGWYDFKGSYATLEEALAANRGSADWFHVVDVRTMEEVA